MLKITVDCSIVTNLYKKYKMLIIINILYLVVLIMMYFPLKINFLQYMNTNLVSGNLIGLLMIDIGYILWYEQSKKLKESDLLEKYLLAIINHVKMRQLQGDVRKEINKKEIKIKEIKEIKIKKIKEINKKEIKEIKEINKIEINKIEIEIEIKEINKKEIKQINKKEIKEIKIKKIKEINKKEIKEINKINNEKAKLEERNTQLDIEERRIGAKVMIYTSAIKQCGFLHNDVESIHKKYNDVKSIHKKYNDVENCFEDVTKDVTKKDCFEKLTKAITIFYEEFKETVKSNKLFPN